MSLRRSLVVVMFLSLISPAIADTPVGVEVDAALPSYKPVKTLRGRLRSVGSDTMNELMKSCAEQFVERFHPKLRIMHEGKGSSSAPPAICEGLADVGPMSRPLKDVEVKQFVDAFGGQPVQLATAIDAIAVYVHPSNPVAKRGLNLQELDAIFSTTRKLGYPRDVTKWGDIGVSGDWATRSVTVFSRNKLSGTYALFRKVAMGKGEYKTTNREMVGSAAVIDGVAADANAIGYTGIGYKSNKVSIVPISAGANTPAYLPDPKHAYSGAYPFARPLLITVARKGDQPLTALQQEFLRYVFSREGQTQVAEKGFFPIDAATARKQLKSAGIEPGF